MYTCLKLPSFSDDSSLLDFKISPCSKCCILLLGYSPAFEFYVPTFRNTLSVPSS